MTDLRDHWGNGAIVELDGKLFWDRALMGEEDWIGDRYEELLGAEKAEGQWYVPVECGAYRECLDCATSYSKLNCDGGLAEILKDKEDGTYKVLVEMGCWTDYHWEYGAEGDGESALEVLERVEHIQEVE
jgi:hypothetical protein